MVMKNIAFRTFEAKVTARLLLWAALLVVVAGFLFYVTAMKNVTELYVENIHNRMLINYEYTRRVLSDVYVQITNNVHYIEQTLDKPEGQKSIMERIVRNGNRVHSCGMNFIRDYYPQKGHRYCPFAWRNPQNPDEILTEEKGDDDFDYLEDEWFTDVIKGDTAMWSEPFYDGYDNKTTLAAYMVPIHDATGRPVAVLGADVSLSWLTAKLDETDSTYNVKSPLAARLLGLKRHSFIINYDGRYITHPEDNRRLEGIFFKQLKTDDEYALHMLIEQMESGATSIDEGKNRYEFNGEDCYVVYAPIKYTDWMLVTVVPCKMIDIRAMMFGLKMLGLLGGMLLLMIAITYLTIRHKRRIHKRKHSSRILALTLLAALTLSACTTGDDSGRHSGGSQPIDELLLQNTRWHAANVKIGEQWITADKAGYHINLHFTVSTYDAQLSKDGKFDPATGEAIDNGWIFSFNGNYKVYDALVLCYEGGLSNAVMQLTIVNATDRQLEASLYDSHSGETIYVRLTRD